MIRRLFLVVAMLLPTAVVGRAADENPIVTLVKSKVKDPTHPFTMIVAFKVKAGEEKAFADSFGPCLAASRKEAGCLTYQLNRSVENPSHFTMYERFKSVAALESHAKEKHVTDLLAKIGPMLEGAPDVHLFTPAGE